MQQRQLGKSGIEVAPLILGGNVFGWTADETASFAVLDAWVDLGFNAIDTADVYSRFIPGNVGGESETVIGKWIKKSGKRDKVVIATKVGLDMGEGRSLRRNYIMGMAEASLKRLQAEMIDLYQSHRDHAESPIDETLRAYEDLIQQGKVRAIGASNYTAPRLKESLDASKRLGLARYETLQPLYNLYDRGEYEGALQQLCSAESVSVIPYFGLAAGFLTGKYRSEADLKGGARDGMIKRYLDARGMAMLATLDDTAAETGATPAQVSLAWLMAKPGVTPIASATSVAQLRDIAGAASLTLSAEAMARLDAA
jgi:aryl-alcohol dehydrogenase-like predicted oxidoreductase